MTTDPFALPPKDGLPTPEYREAVVHLASEYWPYARTGGLAEAVRGIARYQAAAGATTFVVLPLYRAVRLAFPHLEPCSDPFEVRVGSRTATARIWSDPETQPNPGIRFVECEDYFDREGIYGPRGADYSDNHLRFAFFCTAALTWLPHGSPGQTIIHSHDWHTALAPVMLRTRLAGDPYYDQVPSVLTVHNAGYQGHYGPEILDELGLEPGLFDHERMEWYGRANLLKGGLVFSDIVTTVSPTHARELRTGAGGFGLQDTFSSLKNRFVGILNGIDYEVWDPERDPWIEANFGADDLSGKSVCKAALQKMVGLPQDPDIPLFGMTARLAEQKGFDILLEADMPAWLDAQWIFLGEGEERYENALRSLSEAHPTRVAAYFDFTEVREHKLLAGADLLLMPSQYEPCGLTQMRAQRYGALPVARRVGGLADTVADGVTGFLFDEYQAWALGGAVQRAVDLYRDRDNWNDHVHRAMSTNFSWRAGVGLYQDGYRRASERRREQPTR